MAKKSTLLGKFDSVNVSETLPITNADMAFCDRIQRQYEESVDHINLVKEHLTKLDYIVGKHPYKKIEHYGKVSDDWEDRKKSVNMNPFSIYTYTNLYSLVTLKNFSEQAETTLQREIIEYFDLEYGVQFGRTHNDYRNPDTDIFRTKDGKLRPGVDRIHYSHVVIKIIDFLGGLTFIEKGISNIINNFKDAIHIRKDVIVTKDKIVFPTLFYIKQRHYTPYTYEIDGGFSTDIFLRALYLFEHHRLPDSRPYPSFITSDMKDISKPFSFENSSIYENYKYYKNNKFELRFKDKSDAQKFFDYFDLGNK